MDLDREGGPPVIFAGASNSRQGAHCEQPVELLAVSTAYLGLLGGILLWIPIAGGIAKKSIGHPNLVRVYCTRAAMQSTKATPHVAKPAFPGGHSPLRRSATASLPRYLLLKLPALAGIIPLRGNDSEKSGELRVRLRHWRLGN